MIPKEVLQHVRRIQIATKRTVNAVFAGQYESTFKGRGMQFDQVRDYIPGDDVRAIDWNVTARMGKPFIKSFVEEREMTVMLVVDRSASGDFGTHGTFKNELAAEFCAILAFSAIKNNDKVGLITFTDRIETFIPPKKGTSHVLRVIRELLYSDCAGCGTDVAGALEYLAKVISKRATVFLVSDFLCDDIRRTLTLVNKRHDLIAVRLEDDAEMQLPPVGTGGVDRCRNRKNHDGRCRFAGRSAGLCPSGGSAQAAMRDDMFRAAGVDAMSVRTGRALCA